MFKSSKHVDEEKQIFLKRKNVTATVDRLTKEFIVKCFTLFLALPLQSINQKTTYNILKS